MGLTVTEDTPADMLAGNMELLVQLPPRINDDEDDDVDYDSDGDEDNNRHHRNHHRHHSHHHTNGHHPRRTANGNARKVIVARSTPMMDLLVQVATSQKLSASSYTLEAIGEHGLVLTHHPNTPIGALDALQVKLLPKQGTFAPMKTRHANQPFEPTFRLQVHLPRNQLYVSRVSARMNLGKILDEVCREKNLDRNNYELRHPANIEETLDPTLSLQDYHLQEVTLCPKRRQLGSSLSSQDIMALQRQEERRRQEAKQSVFGFAFKKSKESSLSTDSLGERSVSPARSDGTGRSVSPQAPTAPTRPQRKRRPAPKPPTARLELENTIERETTNRESERTNVISHSRNSSDSSGYHEASVLSDNLDSNIRVPETLPRRSRLQLPSTTDSPGRNLAETSEASKSLGNLAAVSSSRNIATTIARGASNTSLVSAGLRKKKAAPAPPPPLPRPLSSAISTQALERIIDSEESLPPGSETFQTRETIPDVEVEAKIETRSVERRISDGENEKAAVSTDSKDLIPEASECHEKLTSTPNVEPARERKRVAAAPVPRPRYALARYAPSNAQFVEPQLHRDKPSPSSSSSPSASASASALPRGISRSSNNSEKLIDGPRLIVSEPEKSVEVAPPSRPLRHKKKLNMSDVINDKKSGVTSLAKSVNDRGKKIAEKSSRQITEGTESVADEVRDEEKGNGNVDNVTEQERKIVAPSKPEKFLAKGVEKVWEITRPIRDEEPIEEIGRSVSHSERYSNSYSEEREARLKPRGKKFSEDKQQPDKTEDRKAVVFQNLSSKINLDAQLTLPIIESRRSCAIISTIPKCDHFSKNHVNDEEDGEKSPEGESTEYKITAKVDSGLGSSFGAGKSILDTNYRHNIEYTGGAAIIVPSSNDAVESGNDELELESFEMFETPETRRKWTKVLRSYSELNNFEINGFSEDVSRHLTSRSVDFTHALNPKLADMNLGENDQKYYQSLRDIKAPLIPLSAIGNATQLPAFLTSQITWETKKEYFPSVEIDAGKVGSTLREPAGSDGSASSVSTLSVPRAAASEPTSDLLKKVSDTLSGSLRSPTVANGLLFSASNDHRRSGSESSSLCVDLETPSASSASPRDGEPNCKLEVNGAQPAISEVIENLCNSEIIAEFNDDKRQPAPPPTEWEYQLPEPPTAFRDTQEIIGGKKKAEKFTAILKTKITEVVSASSHSPMKTTPEAHEEEIRNSEPMKEEIFVNRSRKVVKKDEEELPSDIGRVPWPGVKPVGDSGSRRASYASSTPSVAPVDNTLSNFVITTYSKPKNVDIFGKIERGESEPRSVGSSRKNSPAFNVFNVGQVAAAVKISQKNSTEIIKESQSVEKEKTSTAVAEVAAFNKNGQLDVLNKENEIIENIAVSRSNIKISIATKPRPRADTISGETLQRKKFTLDLKSDDKKPIEEAHLNEEITPANNNQKFSQWRDNILKKQKTQTAETQLQSLQVLRSMLPQSEDPQKHLDAINTAEVVDAIPSVETRAEAVVPKVEVPVPEVTTAEPRVKRYTYAGPPAIDLGSWSDRSHSRVHIKSDSDYKVKNSPEPELVKKAGQEPLDVFSNKTAATANSIFAKPETILTENRESRKEPNEITKTFNARTTAAGFRRMERPASIAVVEYSSATLLAAAKGLTKEKEKTSNAKEEEIDTRPINFKELKEAFGKEQKINSSSSQQFVSKYGSLARRSDTFGGRFAVRRDSTASSNGDSESVAVANQKAENVVEKRKFGVGVFQQQENLRKTSRGAPMPVVKGFKLAAPEEETEIQQPEKRFGLRVAIADISNGNHTRKNPLIEPKSDPVAKNAAFICIPKPPPTMPIITGVTLKSTNAKPRPKSAIVEIDPRNQLLESIRDFGGANQLRKVPRRNTNIFEGSGLYARS